MSRAMRRWAVGLAALVVIALAVVAWTAMALEGRPPAEEAALLARQLHLAPGMTVADVGAGDGQLAMEVARLVTPGGTVYANELDPALVDVIRARAARADRAVVSAVLGAVNSTNLPSKSCDVIYMRRVYHDLTNPAPVLADIKQALKPGGRFVVIDFEPSLVGNLLMPRRTNRRGHGIEKDVLVREVRAAGFSPVSGPAEWDAEMFVAVFR